MFVAFNWNARLNHCTHRHIITQSHIHTRIGWFFVIVTLIQIFFHRLFSHTYGTHTHFYFVFCVCIKYSPEPNHFTTLNSIMSDLQCAAFAICSARNVFFFFVLYSSILSHFIIVSLENLWTKKHKCIFNSPFSISIYCFDHWKVLMDVNWLFEWRRAQNYIEFYYS